jgi:hypothetical protein
MEVAPELRIPSVRCSPFHGSLGADPIGSAGAYDAFLFVELLTEIGTELRETIAKATADAAGPHQQVENGFRAYFRFVGERTDAFRVLFGSGARRDPEFASFARAAESSIADAIAELIVVEGQPAAHRQLLAHGIVGMTEAASRYWLAHDREPDVDTLAAQLSGLAWAGMRGLDG